MNINEVEHNEQFAFVYEATEITYVRLIILFCDF